MKKVLSWLKETYSVVAEVGFSFPKVGLFLALFALVLWMDSSQAWDEVRTDGLLLEVNGMSWHSGDTYIWNGREQRYTEVNPGLGLMYESNDWLGVKGGLFQNSYGEISTYAGVNFRHESNAGPIIVAPNVTVGFVTGYHNTPDQAMSVQPMALPGVSIGTENVKLNLGFIPGRLFGGENAVTAQLQLRMW